MSNLIAETDSQLFEGVAKDSKIWIYQSNRVLQRDEILSILASARHFAENWQVHGKPAKAMAEVLFGRFLVFAVDTSTPASGCSIDASIEYVKQLGKEFNIEFFNRLEIAYINPLTNEISVKKLPEVKRLLKAGILPADTYIFNNTITELSQLDGQWMIPANESWLK